MVDILNAVSCCLCPLSLWYPFRRFFLNASTLASRSCSSTTARTLAFGTAGLPTIVLDRVPTIRTSSRTIGSFTRAPASFSTKMRSSGHTLYCAPPTRTTPKTSLADGSDDGSDAPDAPDAPDGASAGRSAASALDANDRAGDGARDANARADEGSRRCRGTAGARAPAGPDPERAAATRAAAVAPSLARAKCAKHRLADEAISLPAARAHVAEWSVSSTHDF